MDQASRISEVVEKMVDQLYARWNQLVDVLNQLISIGKVTS